MYLLWNAFIAGISFSLMYQRQPDVPLRKCVPSLYCFIKVPTKIAIMWFFCPILRTASPSNYKARMPDRDKSIVFPLHKICLILVWMIIHGMEILDIKYWYRLKIYLRFWSFIILLIMRSPAVLRTTAGFDTAVIFPSTFEIIFICQWITVA